MNESLRFHEHVVAVKSSSLQNESEIETKDFLKLNKNTHAH